MNAIKQHYRTLTTAARPLPAVLRKPALLKAWLCRPAGARGLLFIALSIYLYAASPLSQAIVDAWYPLEQGSFKTGVMELLNSPILRKLQHLRETRYWQLLSVFWILGFAVATIILILDLPRSLAAGEGGFEGLPGQMERAAQARFALTKGFVARIKNRLAIAKPANLSIAASDTAPASAAGDIAATRVMSAAEKGPRFVGPNRRYRIDRALASGGAGIVYHAEDTVLGREVALKELLEDLAGDEAQAERFKSEARALAMLNHANILPIYDLLEENGRLWLVMELLTGGTLGDRIQSAGTLDPRQAVEITRGIAAGLGFAHRQGFVHRDIKPANILFAADGSFRLTDFGIAKHRAGGIKTSHGLILGSPAYMSPEQAAGEAVDARSDIYSLGITLYQMLTAALPFQGEVSAVMAQHITRPPAPPSTINAAIGRELDALVLTMLAKKPGERYQTADDLIEALDALSPGLANH